MSKKRSKENVQKGNRSLYTALCACLRVCFFFAGVRISAVNKYGNLPDTPSVVLCNHGSFMDFLYAGILLRKCCPHFVIARLYFYHKWLARLLKLLGGFPKSMFAMDLESTKNCLRVLRNDGVLVMMPEARLSTAGRFEDIQENTYSFLKKVGVPVYTIRIHGDYFAKPKWGTGLRRGSVVEAELDRLLSAEEVKAMSEAELKKKVEDHLYYDEFQWLQTKPAVHYRSRRLAEGLENILTICPVCRGRHTITTKKRDIFCAHCGKLTSLDDRYAFSPDFPFRNLAQWYDWQKSVIQMQIAQDPQYVLRSDVELRLPSIDGKTLTRSAGQGVCTLDRNGLTYVGTRDGEPYEVSFSLHRIYRLLFGAGENFELYNGSEILYFVPEEKRSAVDWYLTSMILHDEELVASAGNG